ncbi:MAG: DUF971 domain-containing protein [Melioribacteraceae bacterium]|nr:DUF971 domain-containing protein [Melioribacteraceae bacterium]MCF8432324.1 DUF971 domain-containing protein [Melioribacteraceae bacterium]
MLPQKVNIKDKIMLELVWDDGSTTHNNLAKLRKNCPCAICKSEKDKNGSNYIPILSGPQIRIKNIQMVGHYAFNLVWEDGHNTGIYEFNFLKNISD